MLREEVARAICQVSFGRVAVGDLWQEFLPEADAVIPLVLARAAKAADTYRDGASAWHRDAENNPTGSNYCCLKTAANIVVAIRALAADQTESVTSATQPLEPSTIPAKHHPEP